MRRAIAAAQQDRQRRLDLLAIEGELQRPMSPATGPRIAMLRERAAALRKIAPEPKAEAPSAEGMPAPIARALLLLRGEEVPEEPDRDARLKKLRAEQRILEAAFIEVERLMEDVRADQSYVIAEHLVAAHQTILRSVWEAAAALSAAIEQERGLYASVLVAGYEGRPDVLRRPALDGASRLGTLAEWDSQISEFRRRLEEQGVI
jgi:hypothetical protein